VILITGSYYKFPKGWVNEDKIKKYGFPPGDDSLVVVCGLPGVYDKLCGPRCDRGIAVGSAMHSLGYSEDMVVKL
jgi:cytochrome-b5 reductase